MASTSRYYTAYAAHALLFLAMSTAVSGEQLNQMTYKGCYSSSQGLTKDADYLYQTSGWCQPKCVAKNDAVVATSDGSECWCGTALPPASSKVDDSKCNKPCNGYAQEMCGGNGYFSVYSSGIENNVPSENSHSPSPGNTGTATATVASPSVVTQISPGKTVVVTAHAEASASANSGSGGGGGTNPTAVAAGVVVAVVVISGILAGLFFWLRHRRRQAAEEEYKRTQVSDFINGGERKPPQTGYSSMSDSRLDPEYGNRRNSHGSIADNEDFSRKILRVANPDRS